MQLNSRIEITNVNGDTVVDICRDLSAAGMQLFVDAPFAVGDELTTRLEAADDQFPALETVCEVVRCEPEGDGYLLGINIIEVTQ